jgi:eukaryotic-like serine/threonine-protein kinase
VRMLFDMGLAEEAATLLAENGRVEDAITLLCGRGRVDAGALPPDQLPLVAHLLAEASRFEEAADVHGRLGQDSDREEMLRRAEDTGRVSHSRVSAPPRGQRLSERVSIEERRSVLQSPATTELARRAEAGGKWTEAARLYTALGEHVEAARCCLVGEQPREALQALYRITPEQPSYRVACQRAIAIAEARDWVDFDLDQFLARFLRDPVVSEAEAASLLTVATLYERNGFVESARDAVARVATAMPGHAEVKSRLARLDRSLRGDARELERVVRDDEGFRRVGREQALASGTSESFPSLPELPPIPPRKGQERRVSEIAPKRVSSPIPPAPTPGVGARSRAATEPGDAERPSGPAGRQSLADIPDRSDEPSVSASASGQKPRAQPGIFNVFDVPPGFVIAGRYRVERRLGRGGMAAVYKAMDLDLEESIALKVFAPTGNDDTQLGRFKQELAVARKLNHPNIVRLYDLGTHGHASFISMELLEGADLAQILDGSRDLLRDIGYLVQALEGLEFAHEKGVVHRDLKPENLFVTTSGVVKIMDFGIAKQQTNTKLTQAGYSAGTPAYMAPEQVNDFRSANHLSDLYSMGIIAYRMFTGVLPFEHESTMAILMKQLRDAPIPPSSHDPSIPDELEFMILQLLEKDPARRIQSCRELADDLKALRARLTAQLRRRR